MSIKYDCFVPEEFFVSRPGLCVWNEFISNIVASVRITQTRFVITPQSLDIESNFPKLKDSDIFQKFKLKQVFNGETEFCLTLAAMINRQSHCEAGALQNNGDANIFYVRRADSMLFTVTVECHTHNYDKEWLIRTPYFDSTEYDSVRVFFCD